jgi:hypothetical protein
MNNLKMEINYSLILKKLVDIHWELNQERYLIQLFHQVAMLDPTRLHHKQG